MRERQGEQNLSPFHIALENSAARALRSGRVEVFTPAELPVDLYRKAIARLGDGADLMTVYGEVFTVALEDLGKSDLFVIEMGKSEMWDDEQPGFFW